MTRKMFSKWGRTAALVLALLGGTSASRAATYTVVNNLDAGAGSLRQAILDANANAGADVINFDQTFNATITLLGLINITDDLTINGNGKVTISGNGVTSIFEITNSATSLKTVTMRGLKLINGVRAVGTGAVIDFTATGTLYGGISSRENLVLENVDFEGCMGSVTLGTLPAAPAQPSLTMNNCKVMDGLPLVPNTTHRASLWVLGGNATTLYAGAITINNCVFDGNVGNVLIHSGTTISVKNSSFTNNTNYGAVGSGIHFNPNNNTGVTSIELENNTIAFNGPVAGNATGGLVFYNIAPATAVKVVNCTIFKNTGFGSSTLGSQFAINGGGSVNVSKSIIYGTDANNYGSGGAPSQTYVVNFTDCILGPTNTATNGGTFNLSNAVNADPKLAATAGYNGGFVKTVAFTDGTSPAINLAASTSAPTLDGRGFLRDFAGSKVDAGAYERAGTTFSFLGVSNPPKNMLNAHTNGLFTLTYGSPVVKGTGNIYIYEAPSTLVATIPVGNAAVAIAGNLVSIAAGILPQNKTIYVRMDAGVFTYTADGVTSTSTAINDDQTITFTTGNTVVLPVVLAGFTAKVDGNRGRLSWEVKSEAGNREFVIYRAGDDRNFIRIGTVAAGGSYVFYDERPLTGMNYYQLSQVDNDGVEKPLDIRELRFGLQSDVLSSYPNPTRGLVNLKCTDAGLWGSTAVLSDVQGKRLRQLVVRAQQELDLGGLPSGVYLLKYANGTVLRIVRQ